MKSEIFYNGEKVSMKWVTENYGEGYARDLKKDIKKAKPFDTITDGELEIVTW